MSIVLSLLKWVSRVPETPIVEQSIAAEIELFATEKGNFPVMLVGEANYQHNLEQICGGKTKQGADKEVTARLILEDSNPYDRNAVLVQIDGLSVGYLNRKDAKAYRRYLQIEGQPNVIGTCDANIRGGWNRGIDDQGYFGVRLDFDLYGK